MFDNLVTERMAIGISLVTIHRPAALNALNLAVFQELKSFLAAAKMDPTIRCIILTGSGEKAFVAGADISEFNTIEPGAAKSFLNLGNEVMNTIESFHIPVLAVIKGFALGGGCELALACHLRIAGEKARFGMPEVNLGILPGYGGTQRLTHLIGKTKALEMILTGEMVTAEEAFKLGLVNYVMPAGEEMNKAIELATKLSAKAPLAIQSIIQAVNGAQPELSTGIDQESDLFKVLADSNDFKEGTAAFLEKRKPIFTGK